MIKSSFESMTARQTLSMKECPSLHTHILYKLLKLIFLTTIHPLTFGRKRRQRVTVVEMRIRDVTLTKERVTLSEIKLAKETAKTLVNTTM
jgi:hypothetical protein